MTRKRWMRTKRGEEKEVNIYKGVEVKHSTGKPSDHGKWLTIRAIGQEF